METLVSNLEKKPEVVWDTSKPLGDKKRLMDISRAKSIGFKPLISIEKGIAEVMEWYANNRSEIKKRYNVFTEKKFV